MALAGPSGSVYDAIVYGKQGASCEEVIRAAKLAGAHEFIEELKEGYNTYVGERFVELTGFWCFQIIKLWKKEATKH